MRIVIHHGSPLEIACDLLVLGVPEGGSIAGGWAGAMDKQLNGTLAEWAEREGFKGKRGERLILPMLGTHKHRKIALLGMGSRRAFTGDAIRIWGGHVAKLVKEAKAKKATLAFPDALRDAAEGAQLLGEGIYLGAYQFHAYHGTGSKKPASAKDASEVTMAEPDRTRVKHVTIGVDRARILAGGTLLARDLVNTPSHDMTPTHLAEAARSLVNRGSRIRCTVLDRNKMEKMGMGAALAVASGSMHPPVGIHLVYTPSRRPKKRIAIVGKAVTFDSGGLNLKPDHGMSTMKIDMAGAATVIGLFKALPALDLPVEVHGIFLGVENMPSGSAYRPGDVVRAMNGMTIEILNTDAEGRVTLADALSYAVKKIKPDAMVDLATLTGAAVVALGEEITPIMGNDKKLVKDLLTAANSCGEDAWELPLFAGYDEAMNSKIADMNNTGGRGAGSIKGGLFLQRFVNNIPWVHFDIAGPSYCEKETRPDVPFGGTGTGVRTLIQWLKQL